MRKIVKLGIFCDFFVIFFFVISVPHDQLVSGTVNSEIKQNKQQVVPKVSPTQSNNSSEPHQVIISRPLCVPPDQQKIERAYRGRSEPVSSQSIIGSGKQKKGSDQHYK